VLDSGRVEFRIGHDERTSPAGFMLRKGEVFGLAALLDSHPRRIASAPCEERSTVQRIDGKQTLHALEADPASGYLVMKRLSDRAPSRRTGCEVTEGSAKRQRHAASRAERAAGGIEVPSQTHFRRKS
jgi:toluene monooxygenase system ferredoxin subunit